MESYFEIRSDAKHSEYCNLLERDDISSADQNHYSLVYGVNRRALLSTLSFFNVASGALLPDIMHDILGGSSSDGSHADSKSNILMLLVLIHCFTFTNLPLH